MRQGKRIADEWPRRQCAVWGYWLYDYWETMYLKNMKLNWKKDKTKNVQQGSALECVPAEAFWTDEAWACQNIQLAWYIASWYASMTSTTSRMSSEKIKPRKIFLWSLTINRYISNHAFAYLRRTYPAGSGSRLYAVAEVPFSYVFRSMLTFVTL